MTTEKNEEAKKNIGYAFRIGAQVSSSGIAIDITGNFPIECPDEVINIELDKWVNIFNRQRAKDVLAEEEKRMDQDRSQLETLRDEFREADQNPSKTAEKQQLQNLKQRVNALEATIVAREKGIVTLKSLI